MKRLTKVISLFLMPMMFAGFAQNNEVSSAEIYTRSTKAAKNVFRERKVNKLDPNGYLYAVKNLKVNTKFTELTNHIFRDKFIYSSSKQIGLVKSSIDPNTNEAYKLLFCGDISKKQEIKHSTFFASSLNTDKANETFVSFTEDEQTVYFTRSVTVDQKNEYRIFRATLSDKEVWENIEELPFTLEGFDYESPYISKDGKQLFFASNMPGTLGGLDLFVVDIAADGTFGTPRNLGTEINTTKDEKYPYIVSNGQNDVLYFSSKGHYGLGGYDIFESQIINNTFYFPTNMGSSINSISDDFGFLMTKEQKGYFTSDRSGGEGGYDIYAFQRTKINQSLDINVIDENGIALPNTKVTIKDSYNRTVAETTTDEAGNIDVPVLPYASYAIYLNKEAYNNNIISFEALDGSENDHVYNKTVTMIKTPVFEEVEVAYQNQPIYFNTNSWEVSYDEASVMRIIENLKVDASAIIINAHADERNSDAYNQTLSQKRGDYIKDYLINQGINPEIITVNAYGETQPTVACDGTCTDKELQANRRVEITIKRKELKEVK